MVPLVQKSKAIVGNGEVAVFWKTNETTDKPISYFIVQYYEVVGNSRIIHSKLVPKHKSMKEHSTVVKGLKNNVQYLVQVVGVNNKGLGEVEEGTIVIPEKRGILLK